MQSCLQSAISVFQRASLSAIAVNTNLPSVPNSTTAIFASGYGNPSDVLHVGRIPLPDLTKCPVNSVLIRMLAAPVNLSDINAIQGVYPVPLASTEVQGKQIPGFEGVGQIVATTGTNHDLQLGDFVIPTGTTMTGTWRHHLILPAHAVIRVQSPTDKNKISLEALATLGVNPCTAYRLIHDYTTFKSPHDTIIQNGGNSSVGQYVSQLGKLNNIRVISLVRNRPNYNEYVNEIRNNHRGSGGDGAESIIIPPEQLRELIQTKGKEWNIKLALNTVGGQSAMDLIRVLSPRGIMVTYGGMSRQPIKVSTTSLIFRDIQLRGFWMTQWKQTATKSQYQTMISDLITLISQNKLLPPPFHYIKIPDIDITNISAQDQQHIIRDIVMSCSEFLGKKQLLVFP